MWIVVDTDGFVVCVSPMQALYIWSVHPDADLVIFRDGHWIHTVKV